MSRAPAAVVAAVMLGAAAPPLAPAPVVAPPAQPPASWPTVQSERVAVSPNWSDYRLYPLAARRKGQEGAVAAELLVGTDGRPTDCRVLEGRELAELAAGTCQLMLTMRFVAPHDAAGTALASSFRRRIVWLLQGTRPFGSSRIVARLRRGDGGRLQCRVSTAGGPYASLWSALACTAFLDEPHFLAAAAPGDTDFAIVARLNAGDESPLATADWPAGTLLAAETLGFAINKQGDATDCTAANAQGFGPRGLNNLSACGRLLSAIWFTDHGRRGVIETRVYRVAPDADAF